MTPDTSREYSELQLLTSLRRLALAAPDAPVVYLQEPQARGPGESSDFVRVTYGQANRIVDHLALTWQQRLSEQYGIDWNHEGVPVTITLLTLPTQHTFFHLFALWAIGVTVQYVNHDLGLDTLDALIHGARSDLIIHAGLDDKVKAWLETISSAHHMPLLELSAQETALHLAHLAIKSQPFPISRPSRPAFDLYTRIPDPSIISHTSASTGEPKLIAYSTRYWCYDIARHATEVLAQDQQQPTAPRPRLLLARPFYNTYVGFIVLHLISARPLALMYPLKGVTPSVTEVLMALQQSKAAEIATNVEQARQMIIQARDNPDKGWLDTLRALDQFAISGSGVDAHLSSLVEQFSIRALNIFGVSEVGGMLVGPGPPIAPLHILFANPTQHHHLFLPLDERHVQLWSLASAWPRLAHVLAYEPRLKPGQSLPSVVHAQPYPGPGSHHGEPAVNWADSFRVAASPTPAHGKPAAPGYIHLGRDADILRHSNTARTHAIEVEASLLQHLRQRLGFDKVSDVQLFGTNMPGTAAVIQLGRSASEKDNRTDHIDQAILDAIQQTAKQLSLPAYSYPKSLAFVQVIRDAAHAPLTLLTTHKGNLRRNLNARNFSSWLEALPWHAHDSDRSIP
ncbi:hypothetical protein EX895_002261 [Sporisorium graminicola]|uniref:AMP-dependent synthetase/ligase domain-containing protein n=1 Tax=Sporisorium graminicola TaxID=280036 RepID=A0A4U7KWX9_9BASI|nr:hypothetical protein EX895_002261 [Sporisorium graminicola]TKY89020.1 hypothetical protein EX895_002261 [Sporisorium graminicola]